MTAKELVDIDVDLILLRYGRAAVLKALAHRVGMSEEDLAREIDRLRVVKESAARKKKSLSKFNLDSLLVEGDEKAESLKRLSDRFDNRTFLPELKDLKKFIERHGSSASSIKSRASAQGRLFRLLASFSKGDLDKLLSEAPQRSRVSSLGLISDEILGRGKKHFSQKTDDSKE
ncbi:hypothetical protein [Pseudomonas aeruginosa]|uniref:hypothetical protein n=1 Tax=Pseudomonas aeruginosa TaxID=287 RepID=UPI00129756F1|nr:hypothetical protein [Pseudomonas aeruginosa]WCY04360.1 hypothetical protein KK229_18390 [Pseudomonas aeruginosa]HBN9761641.1 hypothetical protein [Pseudomonas aeruginosa]HBO1892243.1 hypothetical protein [Pseudomonas aeruginosa]